MVPDLGVQESLRGLLGMNSSEDSGLGTEVVGEKDGVGREDDAGVDWEAAYCSYFASRASFFSNMVLVLKSRVEEICLSQW